MTNKATIGTFIVLGLVAVALVGSGPGPEGIHAECADGLDNDGDGGTDLGINTGPPVPNWDQSCLDYPYADGNGETDTPPADRFTNIEHGYVHVLDLLEMHFIYGPTSGTAGFSAAFQDGHVMDPTFDGWNAWNGYEAGDSYDQQIPEDVAETAGMGDETRWATNSFAGGPGGGP